MICIYVSKLKDQINACPSYLSTIVCLRNLDIDSRHPEELQVTEMRCSKKLLGISYRDHITNDAVRDRIRRAIGPYDDILTAVKKRKLKWFGHVSRSSGFAKTILQGIVQGGRRKGQQKKRWENNIAEWTGLKFCNAVREAGNKIKRERVARSWCPNGR